MKRVMLVDGKNFFSRGYWIAKKKLRDSVDFVMEMYFNLRDKNHDARFIFCFDATKSARRLQLYPEYKKRISSMPPEEREVFNRKLEAFYQIIKSSFHSVLTGEGYEADDYIACCSNMLKMRYDTIIVSMDHDFYQLINKFVRVFDPIRGITLDVENFRNIMEIPLEHFLDYKCICGDESDNIGGFTGIAEKTAKKFISEFGNFPNIVAGISDKDPGKLTRREYELLTNQEIFARNKELMDLSLCFSDPVLQAHVKRMVSDTSLDKNTLNRVLCENDLSHLYRRMYELCLPK